MRPQPPEVRDHLAFGVGGAPAVQAAVAFQRLERGGLEPLLRLRVPDVVMAVHQHGRESVVHVALAEHGDRLPGVEQARLEVQLAEPARQPSRGPRHVGGVLGLGGDRGDAHPLAQLVPQPAAAAPERLADDRPAILAVRAGRVEGWRCGHADDSSRRSLDGALAVGSPGGLDMPDVIPS
jgi:hypothetical protein